MGPAETPIGPVMAGAQRKGGWVRHLRWILAQRFRMPLVLLIIAFLIVIIGVAAWSAREQTARNQDVVRAFSQDRALGDYLSLIQDAESGQRGFLISAREEYLEPYQLAMARLQEQDASLDTLFSDDSDQHDFLVSLRSLTKAKLNEMDATIDLMRAGDRYTALAIFDTDSGKDTMDEIRAVTGVMREQVDRRLDSLLKERDANARNVFATIIISAILIVVLAFAVFVSVARFARELLASRDALTDKNAELAAEMKTRKEKEAQLVQIQKMEAIGQLTGGIAHDFNNMLSVVISAMGLLRRRLAAGDTNVDQFVDAAVDGARRAAVLTDRLLSYARQKPLEALPLEPNRLVASMSDLLHQTLGEQIQIQTVLAAGLWRIRTDPSQLENSILNLAVNARDAMTEGGRLTIETANCHLDDAYEKSNLGVQAGQYVLIAISDTGPGMPPEIMAKIFEPFFTTKAVGKGTGLGLAQVHGFVKQSGGHIKVYSEPGQGATIKIYLPRYVGEETSVPAYTPADIDTPRGERGTLILVVEDEEHVRMVNVATLTELGYSVIHASRPSEAIALINARPDINLVFTDIVMPEMNGRKFVDAALKIRPDLKVLFTTGYTSNAVVHNGILDSGTEMLMKPFSVEQLAQKISRVLNRK